MFDYFVAALTCPRCGTVSPVTSITNMQTHIRGGGADGSELPVGTLLKPAYLTAKHLQGAGYALITQPRVEWPIRLLDVWTCPECETEQWAVVEVAGTRIDRIEGVLLNRATLEGANFISDADAELLAESLPELLKAEPGGRKLGSVEILRLRLE